MERFFWIFINLKNNKKINQKTDFNTGETSGIEKATAQLFAINKTEFYIVLAIKIVPTSVAVPMVTLTGPTRSESS